MALPMHSASSRRLRARQTNEACAASVTSHRKGIGGLLVELVALVYVRPPTVVRMAKRSDCSIHPFYDLCSRRGRSEIGPL